MCTALYVTIQDKGALNLRESAGTWEDLELLKEHGGNSAYVFSKIKKLKLFADMCCLYKCFVLNLLIEA